MRFGEGDPVDIASPSVESMSGVVVGPDEESESDYYLVCLETGLPGVPGNVVSIHAKYLKLQGGSAGGGIVCSAPRVQIVKAADVMTALQGDDRPAPNNTAFVLDMCLRMLQDS